MIYWEEKLSVGVEIIDEDHKGLFVLINAIESALSDNAGSAHIGAAIDALCEYAVDHFKREETLMVLCGYSAQEHHESEHDQFRDVVKSLHKLHYVCPEMVSVSGTVKYLNKWLLNHIAGSDSLYVDQMSKHKNLVDVVSANFLDRLRLDAL